MYSLAFVCTVYILVKVEIPKIIQYELSIKNIILKLNES